MRVPTHVKELGAAGWSSGEPVMSLRVQWSGTEAAMQSLVMVS